MSCGFSIAVSSPIIGSGEECYSVFYGPDARLQAGVWRAVQKKGVMFSRRRREGIYQKVWRLLESTPRSKKVNVNKLIFKEFYPLTKSKPSEETIGSMQKVHEVNGTFFVFPIQKSTSLFYRIPEKTFFNLMKDIDHIIEARCGDRPKNEKQDIAFQSKFELLNRFLNGDPINISIKAFTRELTINHINTHESFLETERNTREWQPVDYEEDWDWFDNREPNANRFWYKDEFKDRLIPKGLYCPGQARKFLFGYHYWSDPAKRYEMNQHRKCLNELEGITILPALLYGYNSKEQLALFYSYLVNKGYKNPERQLRRAITKARKMLEKENK